MRSRQMMTSGLKSHSVLVLDGGLATELERRGHDLSDALWSARLLIDHPAAIEAVHTDYLAAGADCIIAATYQATIEGLTKRGLTEAKAEQVLRAGVELAVQTRDAFWEVQQSFHRLRPLVAASVGPYGAFLANGAEYRGDYGLTESELAAFHRRRWNILAESPADLLACETIPSFAEARALVTLLRSTPTRTAWFSFSCRDGEHISDGTPLAAVAAYLDKVDQVVAVGVNCVQPRLVPALIQSLRDGTQKPIVVYPNSGETWDAAQRCWLPDSAATPRQFAEAADVWYTAGATLIGGCCRTTPAHIAQLRQRLPVAG
jgi:homocysteine S-methyltransferase